MAHLIFQSNLNSLWFAGVDCKYCNDSWRYFANTLNPLNTPFPYLPIATSLHYLVFFLILSQFLPPFSALVISVMIVQFLASLFASYLLYYFLVDSFHLNSRQGLILVAFYEFIFISPFLLLADSEILFLFYQLLAWNCLVRRRYFIAAITTAMTFAIRFYGTFFVIGIVLILFLEWRKSKVISTSLVIKGCIAVFLMIIIGFSSFFLSWFTHGDFWLPLVSQEEVYRRVQDYAANGVFSIPFLWWPSYFLWVFQSNSLFEFIYLFGGVIVFILGIFSIYALLKWSQEENSEHSYRLTLLFVCGFLGVNLIVSGSNFARYLSFIFPILSIFPLWLRKHGSSSFFLSILLFGSCFWGIFFNIIWWMTYPI